MYISVNSQKSYAYVLACMHACIYLYRKIQLIIDLYFYSRSNIILFYTSNFQL